MGSKLLCTGPIGMLTSDSISKIQSARALNLSQFLLGQRLGLVLLCTGPVGMLTRVNISMGPMHSSTGLKSVSIWSEIFLHKHLIEMPTCITNLWEQVSYNYFISHTTTTHCQLHKRVVEKCDFRIIDACVYLMGGRL